MKFFPILAAVLLAITARAADLPNIVIVLADDMGWGDPRCYNPQSKIPTPNIDALAAQGLRFTDAHTPSSVCTPTRYGLLTGRYAWRSALKKGVLNGYSPSLIEPHRATLAALLKAQGYATGAVGKWHLGFGDRPKTDYAQPLTPGPNSFGFDYFFGIPASLDMDPYVFVENESVVTAPTSTVAASKPQRQGGEGFWREGAIAPDFHHIDVLGKLEEKAKQFIARQSREKPFFLYLALTAPHTPWVPTPAFRGLTAAGAYGDFVAQTDAVLGAILRVIEEAGATHETLIVFTSDNGANWLPGDIAQSSHRANAAWRGQKADLWEGGHRVPFIVRWPGKVHPGTTSAEVICLTDLFATIANVTGAAIPADAGEDSENFLPVLLGEQREKPVRDAIVHHSSDGTFAIRQGSWKLCLGLGSHGFSEPKSVVAQPGEAAGQLYHLADDPAETINLWLEKPEIVARLTELLRKYQADGTSHAAGH